MASLKVILCNVCFLPVLLVSCSSPAPVSVSPTPSPASTTPPPTVTSLPPTSSPIATPPKTPTPTFMPLPSYEELVRQFDYDPSAPLDVQITSENELYGVTIRNIQFAGANGKPVTALLTVPPGEGPFAGMIYLHWGGGNKGEFRSEAIEMASHGVVSLLMDAYWHRRGYGALTGDEEITGIIIDLRRGVDLLQAQSDVDPGRIGFVGHSYGAGRGGILAGVEKRIKTFVLMAGWAFPSRYDTIGSSFSLDGFHYIGHAAPSSVLFQFVHVDQYITQDMADEYYAAASQPKEIRWYNSSHSFTSRTARDDRINWLVEQLELKDR